MAIEWNDVLNRIAILERRIDQLREQLTQVTSELDDTWEVYRQTQSELARVKEDATTLRAILPYIKKRVPAT
jgi:hypothetical protein